MSYQKLLARACELREDIANLYKQLDDCENGDFHIPAAHWAGICASIEELEEELDDVETEIHRMVGC